MIYEVENGNFTFKASTKDILICLSHAVSYCNLVLKHYSNKNYIHFLELLIAKEFYKDEGDRAAIKKIAEELKTDPSKIRKWIREIYEDIFKLNNDQPHIFYDDGFKVRLYLINHGITCLFCVTLPFLPREHETFTFYFMNAKMGNEYFWVKKVEYTIEYDIKEITIELQGGFENKYREFILDKALFHHKLDIMSAHKLTEHQMDDQLKRIYRD